MTGNIALEGQIVVLIVNILEWCLDTQVKNGKNLETIDPREVIRSQVLNSHMLLLLFFVIWSFLLVPLLLLHFSSQWKFIETIQIDLYCFSHKYCFIFILIILFFDDSLKAKLQICIFNFKKTWVIHIFVSVYTSMYFYFYFRPSPIPSPSPLFHTRTILPQLKVLVLKHFINEKG